MSIIRMSPEFLATVQTGATARVVSGGVPPGAKVTRVWIEGNGLEGSPYIFCVEVADGQAGDRQIVFEAVR